MNQRCVFFDYYAKFLVLTVISILNGTYNIAGDLITSRLSAYAMNCPAREFQCANKKCIPKLWTCDNEFDCADGSDESPELCKQNRTCSDSEFKCSIGGHCIPKEFLCDRHIDCQQGTDEDPRICNDVSKCNSDQFACPENAHICFPYSWICDGVVDCLKSGFDEKDCNVSCKENEFQCMDGRCIPQQQKCDGDSDCADSSDEKDCPDATCSPDQFKCEEEEACISGKWRCDGFFDCADHSDERNCTAVIVANTPGCLRGEFECADRQNCVDQRWVCDGERDCFDGSDESPSVCKNITCSSSHFQCDSRRQCISASLFCNGFADCADGSDENPVRCEAARMQAPVKCNHTSEFDCGDGVCIPFERVCDKIADCADASDEPVVGCNVNECEDTNGGCEHTCVDTPSSHYCTCKPGYQLINGTACKDINECDVAGTCSQQCFNEMGDFRCDCFDGYLIDPSDRTKCKAGESRPSLLVSRHRDIRKISLDATHQVATLLDGRKATSALDYNFRTGMIYWSDTATKMIYKAPIDETANNVEVISGGGVGIADGIAVDWIHHHLYWTDSEEKTIRVSDANGNMRKTLVSNLLQPRAIALEPMIGWMFWSDWGSRPRIEKAGMDGSSRQVVVEREIVWPNGITLDLVLNRLYWTDAKLHSISSCDYDGNDRRVIVYSEVWAAQPFGISVFEDNIYWTDWNRMTVLSANKFYGNDVDAVTPKHSTQQPIVVHVYHPLRQPEGMPRCGSLNGHCSHLCLPTPLNYTCACPDGLFLMMDGKMCAASVDINGTNLDVQIKKAGYDETSKEEHARFVLKVIVGLLLILFLSCVLAYLVYRHYLHVITASTFKFDNTVYRKTTSPVGEQLSLQKGQYKPARNRPPSYAEESHEPLTGQNEYV